MVRHCCGYTSAQWLAVFLKACRPRPQRMGRQLCQRILDCVQPFHDFGTGKVFHHYPFTTYFRRTYIAAGGESDGDANRYRLPDYENCGY